MGVSCYNFLSNTPSLTPGYATDPPISECVGSRHSDSAGSLQHRPFHSQRRSSKRSGRVVVGDKTTNQICMGDRQSDRSLQSGFALVASG